MCDFWGMTTLKQHLKDQGRSLSAFAREIGISPSYMSEIASGKKSPPIKVVGAIEAATGGQFGLAYWLDLATQREAQGPSQGEKYAMSDE